MERKCRLRIMRTLAVFVSLMFFFASDTMAQKMTTLNDKSKTYQLRSMENGKWEFHPGWYYLMTHKSYSGGYWKGLNIKWDVKKSNVGQISSVRASEVILEAEASNRIQCQIDTIESLAKEETIRSAERMIDAVYILYEDKFKEIFDRIDELTTIINTNSKGKLLDDALVIIDNRDLIKAEIDYIHETGLTMQMEQAKRQLAYEEVLDKLHKLYDKSYRLAYYAQTLNNLKK